MASSTDERGGKEVFTYYTFDPNNASNRPGELHTSTSKDGIVSTFAYNSHPFISSVTSITETPPGGTALQTAQYSYDTNGNVLTATDAAGKVTKYEYHDTSAPAHLRGLRRSETLPKGVSGTEAVVWEVLADEFAITGDTLSVRLWKRDNGKTVVADAVRIDRVDENGVFTRIVDDDLSGVDPKFRKSDTIGYFAPSNQSELRYDSDVIILGGWVAGERSATWMFTDLEPGKYRIATNWIFYSDRDPAALYHLFDGLPGASAPTVVTKNQTIRPDDFRSYQTLFDYDTAGNVTRSITEGLPAGRRSYDSFGNVVYAEDATGAATVYTYNPLGQLTNSLIIAPSVGPTTVATTTYSLDASGRVKSTLDALGRTTKFDYDANGRVVKTTFADGTFTTHEYDELGNCTSITDEVGRTTHYVYDDRNRRIQTIHADGSSTRTQYDGAGQVVATIDEREVKSLATYDEVGRLLTSTAAAGFFEASRIVNKYDNRGRLEESVDGEGNVTKYRYDNLDRIVQTTVLDTTHNSPNDTTLTPIQSNKAPVHVSTIEYDSNGNIARTAVFDPRLFEIADYSNLIDNAVSFITVPNEETNKVQVVRTAYDAFGRPTKATNADGTSISTIYDAASRVRFTFGELGRKTERVYDEFGRLRNIILPDPDGLGSRQQQTSEYHRDALGNVIREWEYFGAYEGSASVWFADSYSYDARNRPAVTKVSDTKYADGVTTSVAAFGEVRHVYDPAGQLVATIDQNGNADYTRYDLRGRVIATRLADPDGAGPKVAPKTTITYDPAGNVETTTDPLGNVIEFAYDKLNRRVKESHKQTLIADDVEGGSSSFAAAPLSGATTVPNSSGYYGGDVTLITAGTGETRQAEWTFADLDSGNYVISLSSIVVQSSPAAAVVEVLVGSNLYLPALTSLSQLTAASEYRSIHGESDIAWRRLPVEIPLAVAGNIKVRLSTNNGLLWADAVRIDRVVSTSYAYDKNGNLTSVADTRGNATLYRFDELNRQTRVTTADPDGLGTPIFPLATESVYDGYGNVVNTHHGTQSSSPALTIRRTDAFKYDRRNRLVEEVLNVNSGTDNVTTRYEYDAVGNTTLVTDAEGFQTHYRYDNAGKLIDQYRDFGEGREDQPLLQLGTPIASNPTAVTRSQDGMSITLNGSVWAWVPITPTQITHRTVLEFTYQPQDDAAHYRVIGFDTNASKAGESERDRYFQVGGTALQPLLYNPDFHMEFHSETLPDGGILVHIPIGQYLTSGEKAAGLVINHLAFLNSQHTNLDPGLNSKTTYSNIRLYESDEVRSVRTYDTRGNLETIREASDPRNITTRYEYDRLSRLVRTDYDDGGTQEIVHKTIYDNVGNLIIERNDSAGTETVHQYDRLNRLVRTTLPDLDGNAATFNGLISQFTYDAIGNLVKREQKAIQVFSTVGFEEATRTIYDRFGRVIVEVDGSGDETHYRYDSEGNLHSVTDAEQNVTRYTYDRLNRITTETITAAVAGVATPLTRTYIYDNAGNLERLFNRNGGHIQFAYDTLDRKTSEKWRLSGAGSMLKGIQIWEYDRLGRVIKQVDGNTLIDGAGGVLITSDDVVDTFVYDGLGRLIEQRNYDPATIATQGQNSGIPRIRQTYEYDYFSAGGGLFNDATTRKQYLVSGTGEVPLAQTYSQYDRHGRLDTKGDFDLDSSTASPQVAFKAAYFQYDTSDNLKQMSRHSGPSTTYVYDKADRVTSITHDVPPSGSSATDIVHTYGYDNASRVTSFNTAGQHPATRNFGYDKASQLTSKTGGTTESYAYDDNGNRIAVGSQTVVTGLANRLLNDGTYGYVYDKEGNVVRRVPFQNISAANPVVNYFYDHGNRLISVKQYATWADAEYAVNGVVVGQNPTQVINYTYDAQGRRLRRAIDPDGGTATFTSETFVYSAGGASGDELSMRFEGATGSTSELTHRYVYGPRDQVLADETFTTVGSQLVSDEVLWLLADQQGTVRDVVDDTGTLRKHVDYDSFGNVTDEVFYDAAGTVIPRHPPVDFGGGALLRYDPGVQDIDNNSLASTNGEAVLLTGNSWQAVELNYTITPQTVLEFDFYSTAEGELAGFAFDNDLDHADSSEYFKLFGTQAAPNGWRTTYDNYTLADGTKHYTIPVGALLAGGLRRYFVLINDNDVNAPPGNAVFQNVQLYEQGAVVPPPAAPDAVEQLFYYTGQERDAATGLQKHGARWYNPSTGRWISEDPSGLGPDANPYRYVGNAVTYTFDPTGLYQQGNPLANLNLFAGGFTGGTVSLDRPVSSFLGSTSIFASPTSIPNFNTNLGLPNYFAAQPNLAGGISSYLATPAPSTISSSVLSSGFESLANPGPLSAATTRLPSVKISTTALPSDNQIFSNYFSDPNFGSINRRADEIASHKLAQHLIQQGSPSQAFAGRLALSLEQAGHGFYPGVSEYQDAETLFSRDSSLTQRAISGLSLGINIATAGAAPNFGGVSRTATHSLDDVVRAQRLTHQVDVFADSRFYTQIDTISLPSGVRTSGPQSIAEAVQSGRIGETAAGISAAKKGYVSPVSGIRRFPDEVLDAVREVKNVKYQGLTSQIKDYIAIAQSLGKKFELTVRESTILSRPLQAAREAKDVVITYLKGL